MATRGLRRGWRKLRSGATALASAAAAASAALAADATSAVIVEPLEQRRLFGFNPFSCGGTGIPFFDVLMGFSSQPPPCNCKPVLENADATGVGPGKIKPPVTTVAPVRYFDGQPMIYAQDLSSNGFAMPWGQTRSFGDAVGTDPAGLQPNGNRWTILQLPYIVGQPRYLSTSDGTGGGAGFTSGGSGTNSDTVFLVTAGGGGPAFNTTGSSPTPWVPSQPDHLTYLPGASTATLTDSHGDKIAFAGSTYLVFQSETDPGGNVISVTSSTGAFPVNVQRVSGSTVEQWHYDYFGTGTTLTGMLQDVKLQRSTNGGSTFTTVRQVVYDYYTDATTQPGSLFDLKSATIEDGGGNVIDTTVYRYYTNNTNSGAVNFQGGSGYTGGMKYIFGPDAYKRAMAAGYNPATASDSNVAQYADNYFEYDANHRVTLETAQGAGCSCSGTDGKGTFTLSYATNPHTNAASIGPNAWTNETTETLPDGSYNYVFMNAVGEALLEIHTNADGSNQQGWFYNYDNDGRLSLYAAPSALLLPANAPSTLMSLGYDDLLHNIGAGGAIDYQYLSNNTGLVERYDYYTSTTATSTTAGGVTGYYHDTNLSQGEMGTAVPQETVSYYSRTGTNSTVYYRATDTVYSDTAGSVALTTKYAYTFFDTATTVQPQTITTTFPTISTAHNGQGTSVTVTQVDTYDVYGNNIQTVDGDGYTSKTTYDLATGGITKYEQDAGTGGMDLTTNYTVDGLGRTTQMTDPKGNVTYYTYDDVAHESRVYPGWHSYTSGTNTLYTTTGPVQIAKKYQPLSSGEALFDETLTATIAGQSASTPTGHEAITSIQTLHRDITNISGQVIESRDYFSVPSTSYASVSFGSATNDTGTAGGSYHATTYHYNDQGLVDGVMAPTGTIERMVYDSLNRLTSSWVGTNDGSGGYNTADFDPSSPGNMVDVADYTYDLSRRQFTSPPSAPSLSQVSGTSTAATTYYVEITYVGAHGESLASSESSYAITGGSGQLVVAHPSSVTGATGYNVYVSSTGSGGSGAEQKQNSTPVSISSDWTEPSTGLVGGDAPPTQNNVGDGNLSRETDHPQPGTSSADRVTDNFYDWRDRLVETKSGVQSSESDGTHRPITYLTYDNLDQVTEVDQYDGDGVAITSTGGVPDAPSSGLLRAKTTTSYDEWGQVYRTDKYDIIQTGTNAGTLATTNTLSSQSFYDHRGNVIASVQPGGLVGKYVYDGAGRIIKQYISEGGVLANPSTWNSYSNAASVSSDIVLQQTENTYDANGNVIAVVTRQRFHDDATNGAGLGSLMDPSNNPKARASYQVFYYDAADRLTDSVDVGTNGTNGAYTRPGSAPTNSSSTLHVVHTDYNDAGWAATVTDAKGIQSHTLYDLLGRATRTISNWDGTTNGASIGSSNQATDYTYDGSDHVLTQKAWVNNSGTNSVFQSTKYVYGVNTGTSGAGSGSLINSNDLLAKVQYPDKTTGNPGSGTNYAVVYSYNALGETTGMTDRNQTTHAYTFDVLGRVTRDAATTLGAGVSGDTRRYDFAYDTGGRLQSTTGLNLAGSTIYTQVVDSYNGLGQLIEEDQSVGGAVTDVNANVGKVYYAYTEMAGGVNNSRPTSMTYPNGRIITYDYNPGIDSAISRVSAIGEGTGTNHVVIEGYSYLGLSTIVEQNRPQNGTKLSYIQQPGDTGATNNPSNDSGDQYTGLDRFSRIVDQWWFTYSGTSVVATLDRFQYGYDPNGNVLYKNNLGPGTNAASFSELYHANSSALGDNATAYDNLNRLTGFRRGVLSSSGNNGTSLDTVATLNSNTNVAGSQSFSLDAQGNTSTLTTNGTAQIQTTNDQNQYSTLTTGTNTVTLTYDNNGALTTDEKGRTLSYDAWGRVISVSNPATGDLDSFTYDGLSRVAIGVRLVNALGIEFLRVRFTSKDWQVIEERDVSLPGTTPQYQYVYGLSYIDDVVERDSYYDSITGTAGHDRLWAEHDANHDVTSISDNGGSAVERFVYDPYGKFTVLDGATWANMSDSKDWVSLHQGMRWDAEAGLYEDRLRFYSPSLQRFVSQDPTGSMYIDGANLYQPEGSNPIAYVDPSGLLYKEAAAAVAVGVEEIGLAFSPETLPILADDLSRYLDELDRYLSANSDTYRDVSKGFGDAAAYGSNFVHHPIDTLTAPSNVHKRAFKQLLAEQAVANRKRHNPNAGSGSCPITQSGGNGAQPPTGGGVTTGAPNPGDKHHIATNKNYNAGNQWSKKFEPLFDKAGVSMNDPRNIVEVFDHQGPHPDEYHQEVFDRLTQATDGYEGDEYRQAFLDELESLGNEVSTPGSPLNKLVTRQ